MKKNMIKALSLALTVTLLVCSLSVCVFAEDGEQGNFKTSYTPNYFNKTLFKTDANIYDLEKYTSLTDLKKYIFDTLWSCPKEIYFKKFNIPLTVDNLDALTDLIFYNIPEVLQVTGFQNIDVEGSTVTTMEVIYSYSADEYHKMYYKMMAEAEELLDGVVGNTSLTEVEKALVLHDRIVATNDYDMDAYDAFYTDEELPEEAFNAYGTLVLKKSVCSGYAKAYMLLLNRVGIKNKYCASNKACHAWNILYINGKPYHVDATWDDIVMPSVDVYGMGNVSHENFLVSTDTFAKNHGADFKGIIKDYDTEPKSTTYEAMPWSKSTSEVQLLYGKLYYLNEENKLIERKNSTSKTLSGNLGDGNEFTPCISNDGSDILYSLDDGVYSFNVSTCETKKLFTPNAVSNGAKVYDFSYSDGSILCKTVNSSGSFKNEKKSYINPASKSVYGSVATLSGGEFTVKLIDEKGKTVKAVRVDRGVTSYFIGNVAGGNYTLEYKEACYAPVRYSLTVADSATMQNCKSKRIVGDLNNDEKVNLLDAYIALEISAKIRSAEDWQIMNGDIDKNSKITTDDAKKILNIVSKVA